MMKFTIDQSLAELGIKSVVLGIAKNVDPQAPLSEAFLQKQKEAENWALNMQSSRNHWPSDYPGLLWFTAESGAQC